MNAKMVELEKELNDMETAARQFRKDADLQFGILLADDSADDRFLATRALKRSEHLHLLAEVCDGGEAIAYLSGCGQYRDRTKYPFPKLLLLDLDMPRMNGFEVLEWLQQRGLPDLRVVILSGSLDPTNIERALALGADYCLTKPHRPDEIEGIARRLELFMVLMHKRETK